MKLKTAFLFLLVLLGCTHHLTAQFSYLETFNNTTPPNMPSGWSANNSYVGVNSISCVGGNSLRFEMDWLYATPVATWSGFTSNGALMNVEYRFQLYDSDNQFVSPTFPWGIRVSITDVSGNTLYYEDHYTDVGHIFCGTRAFTVPQGTVPPNTPIKISIRPTTTNLPFYDYFTFIDNFSVVQALPCVSGATPANGSTNQNSYTTLAWDDVPNAFNYKLYFGTDPNPPFLATAISSNYTTGILQSNTTYYWKVVPQSTNGVSSVDCPTYTFSTIDCIAALGTDVTQINAIPYSVTGRSTCTSGNDLTPSNVPAPPSCLINSDYLAGQDAVYTFTPTVSGPIDIQLTTGSSSDAAIILYENCPMMLGASSCLTSSVGGSGQERSILAYPVVAGKTYYLVVDNATLANCITNYNLSIGYARPNCVTLNTPTDADYTVSAGNTTLAWTPNTQNGVVADGYKVYFGAEFPPNNLVNTVSGNTNTVTTQQGTLYAWKVIAYGIGGEALNCNTFTFGTQMNNDACSNAAAFSNLPTNGSCTTMTVSTFGATGSGSACQGTADDDVWYSFSIPNNYNSVQYSTNNLSYSYMNRPVDNNRIFEIYDACGGNLLGCYDAESGTFTNLTPGNTYYLRVFTQSSGSVSKFELCLKLAPPVNDNCANALPFPTLTADGNCATVSGNTANTTNDGPTTGCGGNPDDDIWYSFTIPAGYSDILYSMTNAGGASVQFNVFNSCGGALRTCTGGSTGIMSLGAGTYRMQVFTNGATSYGVFDICLRLRPPNDLYDFPIAIPAIPTDGTCTNQFLNSFNSGNEGFPNNCSNNSTLFNDVWYTFVVPTGVTELEYYYSNGTASFDMELYTISGSYVRCLVPVQSSIPNLTPGETYRLRVYTGGNGGTADLCLKAASSAPPANDEIAGAYSITNAQGGFVNLGTQTVALASQTWPPSFCCSNNNFDPNGMNCCDNPLPDDCLFFLPNAYDVWYKFTTNSGGDINLSISVLNTNLVIEAFTQSGMPLQGGPTTCNAGNQFSVSLTNLAAGTYYFRVYLAAITPSSALFTIAASGSALPVELDRFGGTVEKEGNQLHWTTQTEKNVQWHVVERSEEGIMWDELGRVAGQTNSQTAQEYHFMDRKPLPSAYYRLRSVDFDGQFSLSNAILLARKWDQLGIIHVYPSPATEWVTVEFGSERETEVQLLLTDVSGRILLEKTVEAGAGLNQTTFAVDHLPPGLYFIAVNNGATVSAPMRLVKQ